MASIGLIVSVRENGGEPGATSTQVALHRGAVLRMDEAQASAAEPMGIQSAEFPGFRAGFSGGYAAQTILR